MRDSIEPCPPSRTAARRLAHPAPRLRCDREEAAAVATPDTAAVATPDTAAVEHPNDMFNGVRLRWIWTRIVCLRDRKRIVEVNGRAGDCDARRPNGCGCTLGPPTRPTDTVTWFQDEHCHTWCAPPGAHDEPDERSKPSLLTRLVPRASGAAQRVSPRSACSPPSRCAAHVTSLTR